MRTLACGSPGLTGRCSSDTGSRRRGHRYSSSPIAVNRRRRSRTASTTVCSKSGSRQGRRNLGFGFHGSIAYCLAPIEPSLSLSLSLSLHLLLSFSTTTAPKAPSRWTAARHLGERPDTGERRRVHIIHRSPYRCIPLSIRLSKNAYIYNAYVYTYVCGLERASSTATSTSSQADSSGSAGVYGRSAGPYSRSYF